MVSALRIVGQGQSQRLSYSMLTLHSSTHLWTLLGILQKGVAHNELLCTLFQPVNHFIVQRCVHIQAGSRDTGLPLFESTAWWAVSTAYTHDIAGPLKSFSAWCFSCAMRAGGSGFDCCMLISKASHLPASAIHYAADRAWIMLEHGTQGRFACCKRHTLR